MAEPGKPGIPVIESRQERDAKRGYTAIPVAESRQKRDAERGFTAIPVAESRQQRDANRGFTAIPVAQSRQQRDADRGFTGIPQTRKPGSAVMDNPTSMRGPQQKVMNALIDALSSVPGADAEEVKNKYATLARASGAKALQTAIDDFAAEFVAGNIPADKARDVANAARGTVMSNTLQTAVVKAKGGNTMAGGVKDQPLPNAGMKPEDKAVLEKIATALAGAIGAEPDDVIAGYMEEARKTSADTAMNKAVEAYAEQVKAGKVKVEDKAAVDNALSKKPAIKGKLDAAMKRLNGQNPMGASPRPQALPNAGMKPQEASILQALVEAIAKITGDDKADILAPTEGKRGDEQIRSAMAQYAIAKTGNPGIDPVNVGPMNAGDMRKAEQAASLMSKMPKGVKDNMTADDTRKAVILAIKEPRKFEAFVDAVKKAGPNRGAQKAAAESLKTTIVGESIAMSGVGVMGGTQTNGPGGGRQMTGFDPSVNGTGGPVIA